MKRLISVFILLAMILGIMSGCSGNTTEQPLPDTKESENTSESDIETVNDSADQNDTEPEEEYFLEREEGCNQITFYWYSPNVDYEKCDMWIWYPNADGHGYLFHPCDYGVKVVLNVPEDISEVGFIVRKNCSDPGGSSWGEATKDFSDDRFAAVTGENTEVYLKPGDGAQYLSDDGGKTLYQAKVITLAGIMTLDQIRYYVTPATRITSLDSMRLSDGERDVEITDLSSLNNEVVSGVITLGEKLDISKTYTLYIDGFEPVAAMPTYVFDSEEFENEYYYDGDDLGAVTNGTQTTFKVWSPTAQNMVLKLYADGNSSDAINEVSMEKGDKGVWSATIDCGHGTYYTYEVTTALGTSEVVDPYAKAAGVNGNRGMVVDLSLTDPEGFENDKYYDGIEKYNEAVIWEVHVRDFSNKIAGSKYPGKYLAFTERGLENSSGEEVGTDYLVDLGITHVHLQPVYDYATVDESSDEPQFNWGYDPKNYNVPEGSYSTDPYNGEVRINEFKQMVKALHDAGLGVVMDVVYNHTYDANSNFGKLVPYYYYRYNGKGQLSNGSGCGNETASDRAMFRKFMVDSVSYWAREYHIDGFRFDLMALHDVETMQAIEKAVHAINPKAIIYGEGWTGGTTTLDSRLQATQANISQVTASEGAIGAVAVFNDAIRDGLKGSVFDAKESGYISGNVNKANANKIVFGIEGGERVPGIAWHANDNAVINYMACHDNNTLWDKLILSNPDASDEERLQMYRFGASIVMTSRGIPFFLAGEEILRTKNGDSNSYMSSDEINNIDWDSLKSGTSVMEMHDFYKSLIEMRKSHPFFTKAEIASEILGNNAIVVKYLDDDGHAVAYSIINPLDEEISYTLDVGDDYEYKIIFDGRTYFEEPEETDGNLKVPGRSMIVVTVK